MYVCAAGPARIAVLTHLLIHFVVHILYKNCPNNFVWVLVRPLGFDHVIGLNP